MLTPRALCLLSAFLLYTVGCSETEDDDAADDDAADDDTSADDDSGDDDTGSTAHVPSPFCVSQPHDNSYVEAAVGGDYWGWFGQHMETVGARMTRISGPTLAWGIVEPEIGGGYLFELADQFIDRMAAGGAELELVMTINPMLGAEGRDPTGTDRDAYLAFLTEIFERYGIGGTNPYNPGYPSRYFQIGNEEQDVPPAADYVELLVVSAEAARGCQADVKLVGVGGFATGYDSFYSVVIQGIADHGLADVMAAIDLHSFMDDGLDPYLETVDACRGQLDSLGLEPIGVWSLEGGTYQGCATSFGGAPLPELDERDQALFLVRYWARARLAGLQVCCWNQLVDWVEFQGDPDSIWSAMGLIGDGTGNQCEDPARVAIPRIAYYAHQRMAAYLDRQDLQPAGTLDVVGPAQGVLFRGTEMPDTIAVVFTDGGGLSEVTLDTELTSILLIPLITDLDGNAEEQTVDVVGGSVTVTVDGAALLIGAGSVR